MLKVSELKEKNTYREIATGELATIELIDTVKIPGYKTTSYVHILTNGGIATRRIRDDFRRRYTNA